MISRQQQQQQQQQRLPQHPVLAPKRKVPYPASHPWLENHHHHNDNNNDDDNPDDYNPNHHDWKIVAGDSSQIQQQHRLRKQQQQQQQRRKLREPQQQFLRFFSMSKRRNESKRKNSRRHDNTSNNIIEEDTILSSTNNNKEFSSSSEEEETMQEKEFVMVGAATASATLEDKQIIQKDRYWTISGRTLVKSSSRSSSTSSSFTTTTNAARKKNEHPPRETMKESTMYEKYMNNNNNFATLLMDANQIYNENNEVVHSSVNDAGITSFLTNVVETNKDDIMVESNNNNNNNNNDTLKNNDNKNVVVEEDSGSATSSSSSSSLLYQPIRLRAILTNDESSGSQYLTSIQRKILMEEILNPALFAWSKALYVVPVGEDTTTTTITTNTTTTTIESEGGGIEEDVTTTTTTTTTNEMMKKKNLVVDPSQLYDNVSCGPGIHSGLPSVIVPLEHMTLGSEDTDTVIYISVSFHDENTTTTTPTTTSSSSSSHEGLSSTESDTTTTIVSEEYSTNNNDNQHSTTGPSTSTRRSKEEEESSNYYSPSSFPSYDPSLVPSEDDEVNTVTDNVASSSSSSSTRPTCPGTYLASATYCSTDQYDRPIAGILSLCIPMNEIHSFFHDPTHIQRNIVTVMHEMGHILGFNAQSLAHFRNPDTGESLTPRDEDGNIPYTTVECAGVTPRTYANIPLPSSNILNFRSVRGGVRVATIVTPTVQRVARNMFGCRSLAGAELESYQGSFSQEDGNGYYDTSSSSLTNNADADLITTTVSPGECIGDHWSRRAFRTDLMNTIVEDVPYSLYISSLTLAYFADTGWYKINVDRVAPSSMWGRNAGCDFVERKCISSSGRVTAKNIPFFCDNFLEDSPDDESIIGEYQEKDNIDGDENMKIVEENETGAETKEENILEIHGCSLDSSRKAACSLMEYDSAIPTEFNYFGRDKNLDHTHYYGGSDPTLEYCPVFEGYDNGRCDDGNSQKLMEVRSGLEVFGEENSRCVIGNVERKRTALCLPIACVIQEQSLMIKVDGYWKHCSYAGQIISVWWNPNDYVVCPDPSRMCPTFFCPYDCFREGGICDYQTRQCMCAVAPVTGSNLTSYYKYQRFEPCSFDGDHAPLGLSDGTTQVVERIDFELPDYYVENVTVLLNDPRNFDDKVSRMFSQLSSGEVVGLVASFMICAIFAFLLWSQLVRCYNRRRPRINDSLSKVKLSFGSFSDVLSSASRISLNTNRDNENYINNSQELPSLRYGRGDERRNPQKDKMVATLLVQMRTESTAAEGIEQVVPWGEAEAVRSGTIVDLSSSSSLRNGVVLVNRSDLPVLPEGERVLAVIGAHIVEDEAAVTTDDASSTTRSSSSNSESTEAISFPEYASPLYQEDIHEVTNVWRRVSRLRRQLD